MTVVRKLRLQFVSVFMGLMLLFAAAIGAFIYCQQKSDLEYQCMVYLLDIHNNGNRNQRGAEYIAGYPPFFVLEIDNVTQSAEVIEGRFFLEERGVTTDDVIRCLVGQMSETGVLKEYQIRFFNGIRQVRGHRVSFIDTSYIDNALHSLLGRIVLIEATTLAVLFFVSLALAQWFCSTAKKAMDEQTRFISKASHELKTPVSIIRANVDLIDGEKNPDGADLIFGCDNIRHECERMTNLIEAMLLTALPAQGEEAARELVDVTMLLQREMLRFEVVAFDQGLSLFLEAEDGLSLRGDEIQLTRLIDIIVDNAIKYCASGGTIRLTARRRAGRRIRLVCGNDGTPLTKEQQENIFRPFYQVDGTRKGAGLGLSIAHEIVAYMHGSLSYEYADGQNCFILEL